MSEPVPEVEDQERAAEWRLRKLDADPSDRQSEAAAKLLHKLAADLGQLQGSPAFREYHAICGWLGESDDITEFAWRAHDYRTKIGVAHTPEDGEAYLRALIEMAKQTFGMP